MTARRKAKSTLDTANDLSLDRDYRPPRAIIHPRALLADARALETACEFARAGASLATIEAKLGLRPDSLARWLKRGKMKAEPSSSPFAKLWKILREASADARVIAESAMRDRTPDKWLERNTLARHIEPAAIHAESNRRAIVFDMAALLPAARQVLDRQGYAIDGRVIATSPVIDVSEGG